MGYQKRIVLTGAPGSGKSSIIHMLEQKGEYTVREAAEDYIKLRQAQGIREPWKEENFQENILDLQLQREERVPEEARRVFIDRSILDGQAYLDEKSKTYNMIENLAEKVRYDKIFMIDPLGQTESTETRRENRDEALQVARKLYNIYQKHGYDIEIIPADKLEERVKQILESCED